MGSEQSKPNIRTSMVEIDSKVQHVLARFTSIFIDNHGYVSVGKLRRFVSTLKLMLKASLTEINMDVLDNQIFDRITDAESFHNWCKEVMNWDVDLVAVVNKALCQFDPKVFLPGDIVVVNQHGHTFEGMVMHGSSNNSQFGIRSLKDDITITVRAEHCVHTARFSTELNIHFKISDEVKALHEGQWGTAVVLEDLGFLSTVDPTKAAAEVVTQQKTRRTRMGAAFLKAKNAQTQRIQTQMQELEKLTKIYILQRTPKDDKKFTDLRRKVSSNATDTFFKPTRRVANDTRVRVLQTVNTATTPYAEIQVISEPAVTGFLKKRYLHLLPNQVYTVQRDNNQSTGLRKVASTQDTSAVYFKPHRKIRNGELLEMRGAKQSEEGVPFSLVRQITDPTNTGYVRTEYLKLNRMYSDDLASASVPTADTDPEEGPDAVGRDAADREGKRLDAEHQRKHRHKQLPERMYRVKFLDTDQQYYLPGFKLKVAAQVSERKQTKREQHKRKLSKQRRRRNAMFRSGGTLAPLEDELSSTSSNQLMLTEFELAAKIYFALDRNHDGIIDLDEMRVLAAEVEDMEGVDLDTGTKQQLAAGGTFEPIVGSEATRRFFAKQAGWDIFQMDRVFRRLLARAPRDFSAGDHVLVDRPRGAREAVVVGSAEGEGLIRVRGLKDNTVTTVPRSSCERVGYFEMLGVRAKDGERVEALIKGKWCDGAVVGPAPEDAYDAQKRFRVQLDKQDEEVEVAGTDIRYPSTPTLEALRARFDVALRIFHILDRQHASIIGPDEADRFMELLDDISRTNAQVAFERPAVAPRTFNDLRDFFLSSNMSRETLQLIFEALVRSRKNFAPGDYVRAKRHHKISKAKVLQRLTPNSAKYYLRFLASEKIRAVSEDAMKHTGEYQGISSGLSQGDPVCAVVGGRWVDGVVLGTDDQHLWEAVYKEMESSDEDEGSSRFKKRRKSRVGDGRVFPDGRSSDEEEAAKPQPPTEPRYRVWHAGRTSVLNQSALKRDPFRQNQLEEEDVRSSWNEVIESVFSVLDSSTSGEVPYKQLMHVKARVEGMPGAAKPSSQHSIWRLQLADKKLDYYKLDDFKVFCAAMKWDEDVLASALDSLESQPILATPHPRSHTPHPAPPSDSATAGGVRERGQEEMRLETLITDLKEQITAANTSAIGGAGQAMGMLGQTPDTTLIDAPDAARDLQRRVATWIARKELSQLKSELGAKQDTFASVLASNLRHNEADARFRTFCETPLVLAMQDKYTTHQRLTNHIREEIDRTGVDVQAINRAFKRIDLTRDNLITATELRLALSEYGLDVDEECFGSIVREFSSENPGLITYDAFLRFFDRSSHETPVMRKERQLLFWDRLKSVHQELRKEKQEQKDTPVPFPGTSEDWREQQLQKRVDLLQYELATALKAHDQIQATTVELVNTRLRTDTPLPSTPVPGTPLPTPLPTPALPTPAPTTGRNPFLTSMGPGTSAPPPEQTEKATEWGTYSESKMSQDVVGQPPAHPRGKTHRRNKTATELGLEDQIARMTAELDERNRDSMRIISMSGGLLDKARELYSNDDLMHLTDSVQALTELHLCEALLATHDDADSETADASDAWMLIPPPLPPTTTILPRPPTHPPGHHSLPPDMAQHIIQLNAAAPGIAPDYNSTRQYLINTFGEETFLKHKQGVQALLMSMGATTEGLGLSSGLHNLLSLADGGERMPVKAHVAKRAQLAKELRDTEIVNSASIEELVQLADRISEEGVKASRARKSRIARMFSRSSSQPDLKPIRKAFKNIHEMHGISQQLLGEVQGLVDGWDEDGSLGPILLKYAPALQCYANYCANARAADAMIQTFTKPTKSLTKVQAKTKRFFQKAVDEVWGKGTDLAVVRKLVMAPLQHVPRVCRLAQTLLDATDESHKDRKVLQAAVAALTRTSNVINRAAGGPPPEVDRGFAAGFEKAKLAEARMKESVLLARAASLAMPGLAEYEKHNAVLGQIKECIDKADPNPNPKLRKCFQEMDTQSSGTLPVDRVVEGLQSNGVNLSDDQVEVLRSEFDPNGEGVVQYKDVLETCGGDNKGPAGVTAERQRRRAFLERIREREREKWRQRMAELRAPVDTTAPPASRVRMLQERAAELASELQQAKAAGEMLAAISTANDKDSTNLRQSLRLHKAAAGGKGGGASLAKDQSDTDAQRTQPTAQTSLVQTIEDLRDQVKATSEDGPEQLVRARREHGHEVATQHQRQPSNQPGDGPGDGPGEGPGDVLVLNQSLMEQAEALRIRNRRLTEQLNMQEARIVREVTFNQQLQERNREVTLRLFRDKMGKWRLQAYMRIWTRWKLFVLHKRLSISLTRAPASSQQTSSKKKSSKKKSSKKSDAVARACIPSWMSLSTENLDELIDGEVINGKLAGRELIEEPYPEPFLYADNTAQAPGADAEEDSRRCCDSDRCCDARCCNNCFLS